jgi:hypothetical protein
MLKSNHCNVAVQPYLWLMRMLSGIAIVMTITLMMACKRNKKDCPGFPANLTSYVPQETRLVFYNSSGDSLVFDALDFGVTEPHTVERNIWSVGGTGSPPYCTSNCGISTSLLSSNANQIGYSIDVDHEVDTCSVNVYIGSDTPTIDYFYTSHSFSSAQKIFGDTLRLGRFGTTTAPRYSQIEIVYGRGIVKIQDDICGCAWVR